MARRPSRRSRRGRPIDGAIAGAQPRRRGTRREFRAARADGAGGRAVREITVFTHRRPEDTTAVLAWLVEQASGAGVRLRLDEEETRKHGMRAGPAVEVNAPV